MLRIVLLGGLAACIFGSAAMAQATTDQEPIGTSGTGASAGTESGTQFERAFFDRFNPQTALDILERVPGFTLDTGDDDLRGFGAGAGNVLIDGQRASTKTGLEEVLERIPAGSVERVELIRGGGPAGETAGQAVVANVVLREGARSGSWSVELERAPDGLIYPRAELSLSRPLGQWETTTRINGFWERFPFENFTRRQLDANDILTRFQNETSPSSLGEIFVSIEASRPLGGGELTLNSRFGYSAFERNTVRTGVALPRTSPDTPIDIRRINFDSEFFEGEFSAEWNRPVGNDWSLKLIGLGSVQDASRSNLSSVKDPVGAEPVESTFTQDRLPTELLGRVTIGRGGNASLRPETGFEVAYNRLDSALSITNAGVPVILPAADVLVEELRGEAFANLTWVPASAWTIEGGLAVEFSEISVSGDAENRQSFTFFKPNLAINYRASDRLQLRLAVRRTVGQLDFGDFAASADSEEDRELGGNPALGPDQTTRLSASFDWRLPSGFALSVEAYQEWREDVLEQILLPSGAFGVGNAGSAEVRGIETTFALPLTAILPGALLEGTINLAEAEFTDPITGQVRPVTDFENPDIDISFRHDIERLRFSWGFDFAPRTDIEEYFADEEIFSARGTFLSVFVETTRFLGVTTRLEANNIGGRDFPFERRFFAPDRSGMLTGREIVERNRGTFLTLTISDTF